LFDILIENGSLIDGTGAPARPACLGITGDVIVTLEAEADSPARFHLNAAGKVVAPGFIDLHTHSDVALLLTPTADSFLRQGVTTQVVGNCGLSVAPIGGKNEKDFRPRAGPFRLDDLPFRWNTFEEYRSILTQQKPATNVACQVGQLPLRTFVIGWVDGPPSPTEISSICSLAEEVIEQGAVGISLGLEYYPGSHSNSEELVALGRVAEKKGVPISIHMRNEAHQLLEAVREAVSIAEESGCQVEVAHLKAGGRANWGNVQDAVALIRKAQERGVNIAYDAYPYTAWVSTLLTCIPPRFVSDGPATFAARLRDPIARQEIELALISDEAGPAGINLSQESDNITIAFLSSEANQSLVGRTLAQISREADRSPTDALLALLEQEEGHVGAVVFGMSEEDVSFLMAQPDCVIISDGASTGPPPPGATRAVHPRFFSSFTRFLVEYVLRQKLCRLEEAVHRITQLPAERYHLKRRGVLKPGYFADLVVFDAERLQDRATYLEPAQFPEGVNAVIVNGQMAWQPGMEEPARVGRVL
jgi:N-acyl-D-aspartate/D-glutamate deacylase